MSTIEEVSKKIRMASEDPSLVEDTKRLARLAEVDDLTGEIYTFWHDVNADLEVLRGKLETKGCPKTAAAVKEAIRCLDGVKAIMEEELAKPV